LHRRQREVRLDEGHEGVERPGLGRLGREARHPLDRVRQFQILGPVAHDGAPAKLPEFRLGARVAALERVRHGPAPARLPAVAGQARVPRRLEEPPQLAHALVAGDGRT